MISKIKDNTFIKSTLILLFGGFAGKLIGFVLKIIITRNLGTEAMGLFSLLSPTTSLLSTFAVFSYPTTLSKIISEKTYRTKDLFTSVIPISILINVVIIIIILFSADYISLNLFREERLYLPIICISLTMPFISISSIIKGYFWGKQNMFPYMLSNFIEQISRILIITILLPKINNIIYKICFIILVNIIGEIISQIVMILYIPKIKINNLNINKKSIKETYTESLSNTTSKLIGTFSHFLEPIILTNILLYMGYSKNYIVYEYGIINAYSLSLLLMPQFFTQNMSTSLIPELSKHYSNHNYKICIKRIKQVVLLSSFIGATSTIIITLFPNFFLNLLYKTNEGIDYIRLLSPFIILFYIQYPLSNSIQALGKSKTALKISIISSIIRIISIIILSLLKFGMYSLILSIIINLLITTYLYYKEIKTTLSY